jgi:hypothetical protein
MPFPARFDDKREGKRAAFDAERAKRENLKRKRDEGIADLGRHNIFVDFLQGEFDNEMDNEASMWKSQALRTLLARGPAFKVVPAPSTSTETLISYRTTGRCGLCNHID